MLIYLYTQSKPIMHLFGCLCVDWLISRWLDIINKNVLLNYFIIKFSVLRSMPMIPKPVYHRFGLSNTYQIWWKKTYCSLTRRRLLWWVIIYLSIIYLLLYCNKRNSYHSPTIQFIDLGCMKRIVIIWLKVFVFWIRIIWLNAPS